ncbi:MAG: CHAT domain-containing protein [Acidobacteriota bacterium]
MKSIWLPSILLFTISCGICGAVEGPGQRDLLSLYRTSPLQAHRFLRNLILNGHSCRGAIERLERITGDRSFEALKLSPERLGSTLRLRTRAADLWEAGQLASARLLFTRAEKGFRRIGASSEALFCLYLRAEILAQEENFGDCLRLLDQGLRESRQHEYSYLTALLCQSSGFVQWYKDQLPESAQSFGRALAIWKQIPFRDGIVASWNNLALLYDQLGLPDRASDCYLEALAGLTTETEREIRGQLLLNYAVFSFREGNARRASCFLELARHYAELAPADFALAEAEIKQDRSKLPPDATGSAEVQGLIQEADRLSDDHPDQARRLLVKSRDAARRLGLRLFERKAAVEIGRLLIQQSLFEEAVRHYRSALDREEFLFNIDAAFPFRRAVSPFLDGWVRALVALGRSDEARRAIQWFARLRLLKADALLNQRGFQFPTEMPPDPLDDVAANAIHAPVRLVDPFVPGADPAPLREDMSVMELWPDRDQVYVWLDRGRESKFFRLSCGGQLGSLLERLDRTLRTAGSSLPPAPAASLLENLSRHLLHPLESQLVVPRLLLVPHKGLQLLPFELLRLSDGTLLGDRYLTSYLPVPERRFTQSRPVRSSPVVLYSRNLLERRTARLELESLMRFRPAPRILELTGASAARTGVWIHIAGHLPARFRTGWAPRSSCSLAERSR